MSLAPLLEIIHSSMKDSWSERNKAAFEALFGSPEGRYPKTAAKWLAEYGTLDQLMANADKIGGKIGESLRAALPQLPLSRELVTIKTDVPLDGAVTDLALRERHLEQGQPQYPFRLKHQPAAHGALRDHADHVQL